MKKIAAFIERHIIADDPRGADAPPSRLDVLDGNYVGRHRMMSDWHDPDGQVRFMTHCGELCTVQDVAELQGPVMIAKPVHWPEDRVLEFGPAWDEADED